MKKRYLSFVVFFVFIAAGAQVVTIPNAVLKAKLLQAGTTNEIAKNLSGNFFKIDANGDGEIQQSEADNVSWLNISQASINNISGLSDFSNLAYLDVHSNPLYSPVDFSGIEDLQYLNFFSCSVTSVNVTGLSDLQVLKCDKNLLTALDLTGLPNLLSLNCKNNGILTLDVTAAPLLTSLDCSSDDVVFASVKVLILNGLSNLETLNCSYTHLSIGSGLNLTGLTGLKQLYCSSSVNTLNLAGLINLEVLDCSKNNLSALNLAGLSHLKTLDCSTNQIANGLNLSPASNLVTLNCKDALGTTSPSTALNFAGLTHLEEINCDLNALYNLNLTGLVSLKKLSCQTNNITTLNLSGLPNLQEVDATDNQSLASINLSGQSSLKKFKVTSNTLNALNLSGTTGLESFYFFGNAITSLDFSNTPNLKSLTFIGNHLTSLSIDDLPLLTELVLSQAPLSALFLKRSTNIYNFEIQVMALSYICTAPEKVSYIQQRMLSYNQPPCTVNSDCSATPGTPYYAMQGVARFDGNNNGCDESDSVVPYMKYSIGDFTNSTVYANYTGNYFLPLSQGTHTITPMLENAAYFTVSPSVVTASFPTTPAGPLVQNFCVTPNGVHNDLEVNVIPITPSLAGFANGYKIAYRNKGNTTQSAVITVTFDGAVLHYSLSEPDVATQSANTLSWNITDLQPFQSGQITLYFSLNGPMDTPPVNIGYVLNLNATIAAGTDDTPSDNYAGMTRVVLNSYDPNDKTCLEGAAVTTAMIGKYVHYVIRFENTGTAAAQRIVVKDIIDTQKFDISSLVPIGGSHPFTTRITDTNKVEFVFDGINLPPDDANNDGYIAFKIKTLDSLAVNSSFSNMANIYFDYNYPIATNTAITTISTLGTPDFDLGNDFTLWPNPADGMLHISAKNNTDILSVSLYNQLGQVVSTIANPGNAIDVSPLQAGVYVLKIVSGKGTEVARFIRK